MSSFGDAFDDFALELHSLGSFIRLDVPKSRREYLYQAIILQPSNMQTQRHLLNAGILRLGVPIGRRGQYNSLSREAHYDHLIKLILMQGLYTPYVKWLQIFNGIQLFDLEPLFDDPQAGLSPTACTAQGINLCVSLVLQIRDLQVSHRPILLNSVSLI